MYAKMLQSNSIRSRVWLRPHFLCDECSGDKQKKSNNCLGRRHEIRRVSLFLMQITVRFVRSLIGECTLAQVNIVCSSFWRNQSRGIGMAIGIARGLDSVCDCAHAGKHVVSSDALRRLLGAGSGNSRTFDFSFDRQMMCARIVLRRRHFCIASFLDFLSFA